MESVESLHFVLLSCDYEIGGGRGGLGLVLAMIHWEGPLAYPWPERVETKRETKKTKRQEFGRGGQRKVQNETPTPRLQEFNSTLFFIENESKLFQRYKGDYIIGHLN